AAAGGPRARGIAGEGRHRSVHAGDAPHRHPAVRRPADRRDRDHRRADVPAGPGARPDRRAPDPRKAVLMTGTAVQAPPPPPVQPVEQPTAVKGRPLFDPPIVRRAILDSFLKLDPRTLWRNPVMFVVEIVSVIVTIHFVNDAVTSGPVL